LKFSLLSNEPYVLKIENVFSKKINKEILDEAVGLKKYFFEALLEDDMKKKERRNNKTIYYDSHYENKRDDSSLLRNIAEFFTNDELFDILHSSKYPMNLFTKTNWHETQVSRYGDNGQKYIWHIDNNNTSNRLITFVYYFNVEPKKYKGGEIVFSSSPITDCNKGCKLLDESMPQIKIMPENNVGYIFDTWTAHTVLPTTSPKSFKDGRFSLNCWLGVK
jgi:Rps23 Pro-64 3,4-dihydroxylase Tpa1-like proline 4-hydroxylase